MPDILEWKTENGTIFRVPGLIPLIIGALYIAANLSLFLFVFGAILIGTERPTAGLALELSLIETKIGLGSPNLR